MPIARLLAALALVAWCGTVVWGNWALPDQVPVGRLVTNVNQIVAENPADSQAVYVLGRVHALAFTLKSRTVGVRDWRKGRARPDLPDIAEGVQYGSLDPTCGPWRLPPLTTEELLRHLEAAVGHLERAIALDPAPAQYHLSLAVVLEQGAPYAARVRIAPASAGEKLTEAETAEIEKRIAELGSADKRTAQDARSALLAQLERVGPVLQRHRTAANGSADPKVGELLEVYWRERAVARYFAAYERTVAGDLKTIRDGSIGGWDDLISHEAGAAYVRLVSARGAHDETEQARMTRVRADLDTIQRNAHFYITPIVVPWPDARPLCDLVAEEPPVRFDLDGDGRTELWPWPRPTTGLLAWDPDQQGRITSGRQLFGSVTWWMLFRDGYQALEALDDNRDGEVSGTELIGLSVWFDRNSNGRSEPGEVVPAIELGIDRISTRAIATEAGCPANPAGVRLRDGRTLPTYDWITNPLPEPALKAPETR